MTQLSLFPIQQPKAAAPATTRRAHTLPPFPLVSIRLTCACGEVTALGPHAQVLSDQEMAAKGWRQVRPGVWHGSIDNHSRACMERAKNRPTC